MNCQPKALALAQKLEDEPLPISSADTHRDVVSTLRAQHQLIGDLRASLGRIVDYYKNPRKMTSLWDQAKSTHEHTMFGEAIAVLDRAASDFASKTGV